MPSLRKKNNIYLDYAASTPASESVLHAMEPYFSDVFANPSALHLAGQEAQGAMDTARADVADILRCSWKELIFTASATEAINFVLRGVVAAHREKIEKPHIITTNIEHSAVLNTLEDLEKEGVEVTRLLVNSDGLVTVKQVEEAIKENTILVSVMYVNNEIGTIQPIKAIGELIEEIKEERSKDTPLYFHTDGVQATNYLDMDVGNLKVDFMTLSGHKIYGPKGIGLLFKKDTAHIKPMITGGPQEREFRAGTENVPSIIGFAQALKDVHKDKEKESQRVAGLRDHLIERVLKEISTTTLNGSKTQRIPNNANFCFPGTTNGILIPALDEAGVYVSGGSACTARVPEPSHVIKALGKEECTRSSLRFSLGRQTTKKDIEKAIEALVTLIST